MDWGVFWGTVTGAIVGGLVPVAVALSLGPTQARRELRRRLYLDTVPELRAAASTFIQTRETAALAKASQPLVRDTVLAGREDKRVTWWIIRAIAVAQTWSHAKEGDLSAEQAVMQMHYHVLLGTYIFNEANAYHAWLGHSLGRKPIKRWRSRHARRAREDWAVKGREYIDKVPIVVTLLRTETY